MGHYAGLSAGPDGASHHAIGTWHHARHRQQDCSCCDASEAKAAFHAALAYEGPVYLRLCRNPLPAVPDAPRPFTIGQGYTLRPGQDLTIIATGIMVARALEAAEALASQGVAARVVAMPTLKPIDRALIERAARETGAIVTAEEHNIHGGLGSAVAEVLGHLPVPAGGHWRHFTESGEYSQLLDKYAWVKFIMAALSVRQRK